MNIQQTVQYNRASAQKSTDELRDALRSSAPIHIVASLANAVAEVIVAPVVAITSCQKSCAHCCRQTSIMIDEADAFLLAKMSGRAIADTSVGKRANWKGVACAFLDPISQTCTMYEHRPMACRLSYSVDRPEKCETEELRQMVVLEDAYLQLAQLVGADDLEAYKLSRGPKAPADIRAFFPP